MDNHHKINSNAIRHYHSIIPFRLEVAAYPASIPGKVKKFIYYIARPLVAHPVKG
ncbi:hypothetical protein ASZ90_006350 [hydrocarbon metagenome]|uniref:Uncharacterized protein n=1 Tax=hydrocarbon metagenome TaxID=938273 RepID=A0A0W8FSZ5_9ZZZZ